MFPKPKQVHIVFLQCKDLVDQYTDQIVQLIVNGLKPTEVCTAISLCSSQTMETSAPKVLCLYCMFKQYHIWHYFLTLYTSSHFNFARSYFTLLGIGIMSGMV